MSAPILLVDDRPEDLLLLETLVADLDVEVHTCRSGEEALAELARYEFAVVVLDVRLTGMDGFETARRIRQIEGGTKTPLMFLTAFDRDAAAIDAAYGVGAVDYLTKPLNTHVFRSKVAVFVELYNKSRDNERLLRERIGSLEQVDAMKDQFLGILSHELRTPLHYIIGYGSLLEDQIAGTLSDAQLAYVRKILDGADALRGLVDDLLDMSQIRAGRFFIQPSWTHLPEVITEAVATVAPTAAAKHIVIETSVDPTLPEVWGDPRRLMQILVNLVGNAVKFTQEDGAVHVKAYPDGSSVICEIEDTGKGLPAEALSRVFEPFWQADMTSTREKGGAGLGLAISKALVEAHGGKLDVRSEPRRGSVFWFALASRAP